jgi:hypothetical protein
MKMFQHNSDISQRSAKLEGDECDLELLELNIPMLSVASIHERGPTAIARILCPVAGCLPTHGIRFFRPDKSAEHLKKIHNIGLSTQLQGRGAVCIAGYAQGLGEEEECGMGNFGE